MDDIWFNIAMDNEINANKFLELIWSKFPLLASQPKMGVARDDVVPGIRCFSFQDYLIFYNPRPFGVEIIRVVHGARELGELF